MHLLLDIDGVMVPANSWRKPEILADGFFDFSLNSVNALNQILNHSNSEIILTTSHKHSFSLRKWKEIFWNRKIEIKEISRLSKNYDHLNRKDEIIKYLNSNPIQQFFLIIDDDKSLNSLSSELKDRLIQPSGSVGLTVQHANEAIERIKKYDLQYS